MQPTPQTPWPSRSIRPIRPTWPTAAPFLAATIIAVSGAAAHAQSSRSVRVENFPEIQQVAGDVEVDKPIPHAAMIRIEAEVVSPLPRWELANRNEIGIVDAEGFTTVVLSLTGEVKGRPTADSQVGVLLVPDEEPIVEAFEQSNEIQLPIELIADVEGGSAGFFAAQTTVPLAFPSYLVYLYNTGKNSVTANVYVYLRH